MTKRAEYFITFSKYNRGSMTEKEITFVCEFFQQLDYNQLYIVNEHFNSKKEAFEHIHLYLLLKEPRDHDGFRKFIKKNVAFIEHTKDLDVSEVPDKMQLLAGYMQKTADYTVLFQGGFSTDEWNEIETYKSKIQIDKAQLKERKQMFKERIPLCDLPYKMRDYILEKNYQYGGLIQQFTLVLKSMFLDGYDVPFEKVKSAKAKLDLLLCKNDSALCSIIQLEFQFLPSNDESWYGMPSHLNDTTPEDELIKNHLEKYKST